MYVYIYTYYSLIWPILSLKMELTRSIRKLQSHSQDIAPPSALYD